MTTPRNPFILGHKILRPYFCDRVEEEKRLLSAVTNGRNVVMISPRRMGKTSLVHVAFSDSHAIDQEHVVIFIDILQSNSLCEFTYLLGKAIFDSLLSKGEMMARGFLAALKSLKGSFGFDPISGTPTFNVQLGDITTPEYTLDEIFTFIEQSQKQIIVLIDEFQQITKYPQKNTEAVLRGHMQRLSRACFVFAGSERTLLQEMFVSSKRPFYNSAEIMHLEAIPQNVYSDFAQKMFRDYGRDIEREAIATVYRTFDGNTFYMQRTMNGAFAETPEGETCGINTINNAIKAMIASNEVIYREMLSGVSVSQKTVLYAIAQEGLAKNVLGNAFVKKYSLTSASSVQSAIGKLTKSGIISRTPVGYELTDPLLRLFINELY